MHWRWKLATGFAASFLIAYAGWRWERQALLAELGREVASVMLVNGVGDGAARWTDSAGVTWRVARLSGTADAATRARITAQLERHPGIFAVTWH